MKTSYKFASFALLGAVGFTIAANEAQATEESNPWKSNGKVEFKPVDNTTDQPVTPPGTTGPIITGVTDNTEDKDLKIRHVADLDFDAHDVLSVASNAADTAYPAITFEKPTAADPSVKVKMPHFVRFQDMRTGRTVNDHSISAKLTKQFTEVGGTHTLSGAEINYHKTTLVTGINTATMPNTALADAAVATDFDLTLNDSVNVYSNNQAGKGFGRFELQFGPYSEAEGTHNNNVELTILAGTTPNAKVYQAEITWTISNAPATIA